MVLLSDADRAASGGWGLAGSSMSTPPQRSLEGAPPLRVSVGAATMWVTKNRRSLRSEDISVLRTVVFCIFAGLVSIPAAPLFSATSTTLPAPVVLTAGWKLQEVAKVPDAGAQVASPHFKAKKWYAATVPGTVLTTL